MKSTAPHLPATRPCSRLIAPLLLLAGGPAGAAEPPATATVEVVGYQLAAGSSDAASQGQIYGEVIETRPVLRPGEVLEYVPGMVVTQHSGDGKANQYFLRGYNLDHGTDLALTVDQVPVNMPTNAHGQGYSDLNFLIPELVDRIDYRKGPYFAQYGDFSAAGAVDVRYRDTLEKDFAQFTLGSFRYQRMLVAATRAMGKPGYNPAATVATTAPDDGGPRLLAALETLHENGPWDTPEALNRVNMLLRLSGGSEHQGWSLSNIFYKSHWNATDQVPLELVQNRLLGLRQALDPTDGGDSERVVLSGEWHRKSDTDYTRAMAWLEHYQLQLWSDFTFYETRCVPGPGTLQGTAPNPALPCDQFSQWENRNFGGTRLAQGWTQSLLGHQSSTEVGLQLRRDRIHLGLDDTQQRLVFGQVRDDRVTETSTGLYVSNTTAWTNWLKSITGLRGERVDMDVDAQLTPQNSGRAHGQKLSPKLSLILGPWRGTEFFINAGKGFHSNDARGVTQRIDPTTGAAGDPVPVLASARGAEVGARTEPVAGLQSSLALWTLYSNSEIQYSADSAIGSTSANGASRREGVEWNNHWSARSWLLFDLDLAFTRARYAYVDDNGATGQDIPNAVPAVISFGTTLIGRNGWSGGLSVRYFSPYPLSQDGSLRAPSSITTNLRLQNEINRQVSVAVDILNLFGRNNTDIAYQQDYQVSPTAPVVPGGIAFHPAEPRELRLTLRVSL